MRKKILLSLTLAVGVLIIGAVALAHGPDFGRGNGVGSGMTGYGMSRGMGYGMGNHMMGTHMGYGQEWTSGGPWKKFDEETASLRNEIYQKRIELGNLLAASEVDITGAKALQAEINKLQNELSEKRLTAELEFRKNNPDWRPDAQYGYGMGRGSELCWN